MVKLSSMHAAMDYGVFAQFNVVTHLDQLEENDFSMNVSNDLEQKLSNARPLSYFADNAGEIVFDKFLIEYLVKRFSLKRVLLIVRSEPFLNDVYEIEARVIGMTELPQVEILSLPVSPSDHALGKFAMAIESEVIIAKGMANFESFSHWYNFYFLFIAKCRLVSDILSQRICKSILTGDLILHLNQPPNSPILP